MSESRWQEELAPLLRTLQVIVVTLTAGPVVFLGVVLAWPSERAVSEGVPLVTYVAIAVAVTALLARTVIPGVVVARGRQRIAQGTWQPTRAAAAQQAFLDRLERAGDAGKLWMLFCTTTIIAAAILEGATFLLLAAYMLEHALPSLVVGVAMILTLALHVPTHSRAFHWIGDQLRLLQQERQLAGPSRNRGVRTRL